jgi:serine kinase of HPr protein (carbohydrate metabolism regulator)
MIFLFDLMHSKITILIGPEETRNLACFVTPFRIVIDWIAQREGAFAIHASVIAKDEFAWILNGPSGSGKSTMAALAIKNQHNVIADDVAIIEQDQVSAVYRHAKLERKIARELLEMDCYFELPFDSQGKVIFDLTLIPGTFQTHAQLGALVFPKVTGRNQVRDLSSVSALMYMAPNVMREVIGGTTEALTYMSLLVRKVSAFELELSQDLERGFQDLTNLVGKKNPKNAG